MNTLPTPQTRGRAQTQGEADPVFGGIDYDRQPGLSG